MSLIEQYGLKHIYLSAIPKLHREHPTTLWDHSVEVAQRFAEYAERTWRPPVGTEAQNILRQCIDLQKDLIYLHDVGKIDARFQEELKAGRLYSRHTFLGLNIILDAAERLVGKYPKEYRPTLVYLSTLAVTFHHAPLMKTTLQTARESPDATGLPAHLKNLWETPIRETINRLLAYRKDLVIGGWELHWVFAYLNGLVALADETASARFPSSHLHTFIVDYSLPDEPCTADVGIYSPALWARQLSRGGLNTHISEAFRFMQPRIYTTFHDILPFIAGLGKFNVRLVSLLGSTVYTPRKDWAALFADLFRSRVVITDPPRGGPSIVRRTSEHDTVPYFMFPLEPHGDEVDEWTVLTSGYEDAVPTFEWIDFIKRIWNRIGVFSLLNSGVQCSRIPFAKADVIADMEDVETVRAHLPETVRHWPVVPREVLVHKLASRPVPMYKAIKGEILNESHILAKVSQKTVSPKTV
ncbi:CRISPR-associated endonuclease Cas3'' [Coprothermobacteraceae bacterium]|nr:CRISPR-associated endonuclease Cas3'' [Coprothermobacteraceae bacterium]